MIAPLIHTPLFDLGRVVATAAAWQAIVDSGQDVAEFLDRHVHGDWGSVFNEVGERNRSAVQGGGRIQSAYRTDNGIKIWIVTEPVESGRGSNITTICLPSEA